MKLKNIRIDDLCGFAVTDSENPRFTLETENELENAFISSYSLKVKSDEAVLWQTEEQSSTVSQYRLWRKSSSPVHGLYGGSDGL